MLPLLSAVFVAGASAQASVSHAAGFPPGWNKVAQKPPLGWRSWNSFGPRVTQKDMEAAIDSVMAKRWDVGGEFKMSLFDVGYTSVGIDEGWEGCGEGVNGTQHDAKGNPVINTKKFPDMGKLVRDAHSQDLLIGWYQNGCACGEHVELDINYEGDVRQLHALGFDGVKLDNCGDQRNMTKYAELMQATGKSYLIENCHWGRCSDLDISSCPTADWCPFNWFRTSGDINSSPMSWLYNLQTTKKFQDPVNPLSRPGCWAYPDMLEVGRIKGQDGKLDHSWNRAHFGAWCVVSAPLILGMDLTNDALVESVVDIITNKDAIEVNQAWAGHPGGLVWEGSTNETLGYPAARTCDSTKPEQKGWKLKQVPMITMLGGAVTSYQVVAPNGGCLHVKGSRTAVVDCKSTDSAQQFTYDPKTLQLQQNKRCVDVHESGPLVWMYGCTSGANDMFTFSNGTLSVILGSGSSHLCLGVESSDPAGADIEATLQAWAKPLGRASLALLLLNPGSKAHEIEVPFNVLPIDLTGLAVNWFDIWEQKEFPLQSKTSIKVTVGGHDSVFLLADLD